MAYVQVVSQLTILEFYILWLRFYSYQIKVLNVRCRLVLAIFLKFLFTGVALADT